MIYKILFNVPNEKYITEVQVTEYEMQKIAPLLSIKGHVLDIGGCYYNTSYFVKAVPDQEASKLEESTKWLALEMAPQTEQDKLNRQAINEIKQSIIKKLK